MHGVLPQAWAELLDAEFLSSGPALQRVVVIAGFFADEMNDLFLFLALGHG